MIPLEPGCSVVVPVFNSEENLARLIERLESVLQEHFPAYEVVLVNDGSSDSSWQSLMELSESRAWIRAIDLRRNYGQHNALLCGIRAARYDTTITLDDDLQHPPEEIPKLLAKLDGGFDVVYGTPEKEPHGLWRGMASRVTKLALQSVMGAETARRVSAFRVFRTAARDAFEQCRGPRPSIDVLLSWGAARFGAVTVRHDSREFGESNYTFAKLFRHALNMMTGYSSVPLQLASVVGFGFTLFGLGVLAYVLLRYLIQGGSIPGFPFLASIIAIFSGAQLFALGVIGEYLARMHFRMMDRPTYVVREDSARGPGEHAGPESHLSDAGA